MYLTALFQLLFAKAPPKSPTNFFANNVMVVFASATIQNAGRIRRFLDDFSFHARLSTSSDKSSIFFSSCNSDSRVTISGILKSQGNKFPVWYLGLPLSSKSLKLEDCRPLLGKLRQKLARWKSKILSFTGRWEPMTDQIDNKLLTNLLDFNLLINKACLNLSN